MNEYQMQTGCRANDIDNLEKNQTKKRKNIAPSEAGNMYSGKVLIMAKVLEIHFSNTILILFRRKMLLSVIIREEQTLSH